MSIAVRDLSSSASWSAVPQPSLLFVHTTWCGYSRKARPIMESVAQSLGSTVPVIAIDADVHPTISKALRVKSFPTILFYNHDSMHVFQGERSVDAIVGHVCTHSGEGTYHTFCKNPLE